MLKKSLKL